MHRKVLFTSRCQPLSHSPVLSVVAEESRSTACRKIQHDVVKKKQANYSGPPQIIFELIEPVGSVETVEPIKLIKQLNQMIHGNY